MMESKSGMKSSTYFQELTDSGVDDEAVSIQAFRLECSKFFVVRNLDRFVGIARRSQINHEDVRSPHGDFLSSLRRSEEKETKFKIKKSL